MAKSTADLSRALRERGYPIRQHLEEEGWTRRKLTVVDLDAQLVAAHQAEGLGGLKRALAARGQFSFPALDIEAPLPRHSRVILAASSEDQVSGVGGSSDGQAAVVVPAGKHGLPLGSAVRIDSRRGLEQEGFVHIPCAVLCVGTRPRRPLTKKKNRWVVADFGTRGTIRNASRTFPAHTMQARLW